MQTFHNHYSIRKSVLAALGFLILSSPVLLAEPPGGNPTPSQAESTDHVPGEVLLKFRPEVTAAERKAMLSQMGMTVIRHNPAIDMYRLGVPGLAEEAVKACREDPRVEWVQLNNRLEFDFVPDDFLYRNFDGVKTDLQKWYFGKANLKAEAAWNLTRGRRVVIAIIDSGVALNHPDLAKNIFVHPGEVPGNGLDDDGNGFVDDVHGWDFCRTFDPINQICMGQDNDPNPSPGDGVDNDGDGRIDEGNFHGTAVAGVAGAVGDNGIDIAGAAHKAKLMPLKVGDDDSTPGISAVIDAIVYAADNGAHVINLSVGGNPGVNCATVFPAVEAAVTYAFNQGAVVVASAGNDNTLGPITPASCTHALAVGGSDSGNTSVGPGFPGKINERAPFSNFGQAPGQSHGVDVVAPAVHIAITLFCTQGDVAAGIPACTFAGETPIDVGVLPSGTSISTPLVSGLAALIISRARDLGIAITPTQVRNIIRRTAKDLPNDPDDTPDAGAKWDGKGRVNFRTAVEAVDDLFMIRTQ